MMLRDYILNHLVHKRSAQRKLAKVLGISESTISRYLSGREELKFETVLRVIKVLFPEKETDFMMEYALTQKGLNARCSLEYCMIHKLWPVAEELIDRLYQSGNWIDKEWAKVYKLEFSRANGKMSAEEILLTLKSSYPSILEVQIIHTFTMAYIYYDMGKPNLTLEVLDGLEEKIEQVKSLFLKKCFSVRLGLLLMGNFLYQNQLEKAREYGLKMIEQDVALPVKAEAFYLQGSSYMLEDYGKAKEYLEQAIEYFNKMDRQVEAKLALRTLSFTETYWGIEREYPFSADNDSATKSSYAYYLLKRGEKEAARELLNQVDSSSLLDWEKSFYFYYKGLLDQDKSHFYRSIKWFKRTENLFHLHLPIQELEKMNEEKVLLEIFTH